MGHQAPLAVRLALMVLHIPDTTLGDADIGHDHGMQHQVRDDDHGNTDASGHGQVPYDINLDEQQRQEAEGVT